jgi:hypothetical protein
MRRRWNAIVGLLSLILAEGAHADSMRCGSFVVNETIAVAELLEKCGEPASKEVKTEDVIARNPDGFTRKVGTKTIERWIYQRSNRALPMAVTIVDGKVIGLERAD